EEGGDPLRILGGVAEMDGNEGRPGVAGDAPLELREELLPRREAAAVEGPVRVDLELVPPLVGRSRGLEEGDRIAGVDRDRHAQLAGGAEDGVELRIVDGDDLPGVVQVAEAEALRDLHAARAELAGPRQVGGHAGAVAGAAEGLAPVEEGED